MTDKMKAMGILLITNNALRLKGNIVKGSKETLDSIRDCRELYKGAQVTAIYRSGREDGAGLHKFCIFRIAVTPRRHR